jgi:hypothetical protein
LNNCEHPGPAAGDVVVAGLGHDLRPDGAGLVPQIAEGFARLERAAEVLTVDKSDCDEIGRASGSASDRRTR